MTSHFQHTDTIVALSTPSGHGAIAVIRISGKEAIQICDKVFFSKKKNWQGLKKEKPHSIHFGTIRKEDELIDEVLLSLFLSPHSYTGEDIVEISCHGSVFIQQEIIQLLLHEGARLATAGEFTLRAFLNGKMDLAQAEAVADLIASDSFLSHQLAMKQMRGVFSDEIKKLREQLINFASLIELELDFSEEDVQFANRDELQKIVLNAQKAIQHLLHSFEIGNVIKHGLPVAIVGKPNVGKSTLLNVLLNEERAIVSEIPGTTRDFIEDEITIDGIHFRFIDTAGIRETQDSIESIGVSKTYEKIEQAVVVIYLFDVNEATEKELEEFHTHTQKKILYVGNKIDKVNLKSEIRNPKSETTAYHSLLTTHYSRNTIFISAKENQHIDKLKAALLKMINITEIKQHETIVSNARHADALQKTADALENVYVELNNNISGELLAADVRKALYHLGEITGTVSTDDLLENIFSRFCIGK